MRFLLIGLSALGILAAGGIVAIYLVLHHYSEGLPDYRALADYKPKVVTRIHAGDGELLAEFSTEKRIFVPIDSIPKQVKENPANYAPEDEVLQVVEPVPFGAFGMGDWLVRQERNRLTTILPPVRG